MPNVVQDQPEAPSPAPGQFPVGVPSPFPGQDLRLVVEGALAAEGHLFTAGEARAAGAMLALSEGALELYARLSLRQPRAFRLGELKYAGDPSGQAAEIIAAGLGHATVPDRMCLPAFSAEELRGLCRGLGLDHRGARPALEERLGGRQWVNEPVLLLSHLGLLRRMETLFFQTPHLGRQDLVLGRLGLTRWASYAPTGGPGLFRSRSSMLRWERARARAWRAGGAIGRGGGDGGGGVAGDVGDVETILAGGPGDTPLHPFRYALEARLAEIEGLEPVARAPALARLLERIEAGLTGTPREAAAVQGTQGLRLALSRALEEAGDHRAALIEAVAGQGNRTGEALACARTARRLARALKRAIPPVPELVAARGRTIEVGRQAATALIAPRTGGRPLWPTSAGGEATIERAVIDWLGAIGRPALHAEQSPWIGLYALVFADLYFLPVENMLPTAFRTGPLDVGTPGFYRRRRHQVDARLSEVSRSGTADYITSHCGVRLAGLWNVSEALFLAQHAPGPMTAAVLGRLAREGWAAAAGLPDLFVAGGAPARLELPALRLDALPGRLPECGFLAEIKGPTDSLRDEQRIWMDELVKCGIHVELWTLRVKTLT